MQIRETRVMHAMLLMYTAVVPLITGTEAADKDTRPANTSKTQILGPAQLSILATNCISSHILDLNKIASGFEFSGNINVITKDTILGYAIILLMCTNDYKSEFCIRLNHSIRHLCSHIAATPRRGSTAGKPLYRLPNQKDINVCANNKINADLLIAKTKNGENPLAVYIRKCCHIRRCAELLRSPDFGNKSHEARKEMLGQDVYSGSGESMKLWVMFMYKFWPGYKRWTLWIPFLGRSADKYIQDILADNTCPLTYLLVLDMLVLVTTEHRNRKKHWRSNIQSRFVISSISALVSRIVSDTEILDTSARIFLLKKLDNSIWFSFYDEGVLRESVSKGLAKLEGNTYNICKEVLIAEDMAIPESMAELNVYTEVDVEAMMQKRFHRFRNAEEKD